MPTNLNVYSAAALNVVDRISDPLIPELDPSLLDFGPTNIDFGVRKDDPLSWTSQSLLDSMNLIPKQVPSDERRDDDDDMHIELELDLGDDDTPSIEIGRRDKGPSRPIEDDLISNDDKFPGLGNHRNNAGIDGSTRSRFSSVAPPLDEDAMPLPFQDDDMIIDNANDFAFAMVDDLSRPVAPSIAARDARSTRDSESPLSSHRSIFIQDFEREQSQPDDPEEEVTVVQAQKAKKRKFLQADADTVIPQTQINAQQTDRSAILKPVSLLSRDPVLLNLMTMQRDGGFVSHILGEGRAKGWAPELRGILSVEAVRKSGERKRKRDSGVEDLGDEEAHAGTEEVPQLEIPEESIDNFGPPDEGIDMNPDDPIIDQSGISHDGSAEIELGPIHEDDPQAASDHEAMHDPFDDTTAPLLFPEEQGAVSVGTQHAVHLLRDRFASSEGGSTPRQNKATILFQEILPETTTSKAEATKMFFEVLVLATKDAVKVEQSDRQLGGPLRIRGKRGLWGAWAEKEAGGEIAEQVSRHDHAIATL